MTGSAFSDDVATGRRTRTVAKLVARWTKGDLLVIDGLSNAVETTAARDLLVEVLDRRVCRDRQTIVVSERLPGAIPSLGGPLRDRLRDGVTCHLGRLTSRSARQVLSHTFERQQVTVTDEALRRISEADILTIGRLVDAARSLAKTARRRGGIVTERMVDRFRRDEIASSHLTLSQCERVVGREFEASIVDMRSHSRSAALSIARQVAMYIGRHRTGQSYAAIGRHFGGRNHTTVLHACRRVEKLLQTDPEFAKRVEMVHSRLGSG